MESVTTAILAAMREQRRPRQPKRRLVMPTLVLKALLTRKFGGDSKASGAIEKLEETKLAGWKETVGKEVAKAGANQDQELIAAAETVLAKLKELPAGAQQQNTQSAIGS